MEMEEVKDEVFKKKSKKRKNPNSKLEGMDPIIIVSDPNEPIDFKEPQILKDIQEVKKSKSSKKTIKKKITSTSKRKKRVEDDIKIKNALETNIEVPVQTVKLTIAKIAKMVDQLIEEAESQPTGQAEDSNEAVEEVANDIEVNIKNATNESSQEQKKDSIILNTISESADQVLTESLPIEIAQEIVLPLTAVKIRNVVGKINNLVVEVIPNKVIVQGTVHSQIFFVGNDGIVHHLANDVDFSTFLDIPGVQPGMNAFASGVIEDVIFELAPDGLSITLKTVLEVFVKVTETVQLGLVQGTGPTLYLKRVIGENSAQTLVESDLELFTPAVKIDEIIGSIQDITPEIINDKVIIQGILHKQIFFIGADNMGRHQAEDLPFSFFVDVPGATPGMNVQIQPRIEAILFNLSSDTLLNQKAVLEFFVKVTENVMLSVDIGNGPLLKVDEFVGENTVQELSETLVTLDTAAIKIREIVVQVRNLTSQVIPNKVIVQGTLHKQIFFIGTDNIEHHQAEDVPFAVFLDIAGVEPGNDVNLIAEIEGVFFDLLTSTDLRQKVIFSITAITTEQAQLNLVTGIGQLFKVEQVVGENTRQLLVISKEKIVPPVPPPPVVPVRPVVTSVIVDPPLETVIGSQQILLQTTFPLPISAIKVKEVDPVIANVSVRVIADGVLVEGNVNKTIVFVGTDNIVRSTNEQVPFSILVNIPGITPAQITNTKVLVEDIIVNLNAAGDAIDQTVVLKAEVEGRLPQESSISAVTNVTGPSVSQTKLLVQGLVRTSNGDVFEQFDVVTDVSGPGIIGVTHVQTDLLQKVGEPSSTPVTIVTAVQVAP
jgi:hypothetical protein